MYAYLVFGILYLLTNYGEFLVSIVLNFKIVKSNGASQASLTHLNVH